MNEKSEKKAEPENKVVAKTEGKSVATLAEAASVVPLKQLEAEKDQHAITLKLLSKAQAELVAEKAIVAARDLVLASKDKSIADAEITRNLAVKETCEAKSKLVVANKVIESLKMDIENLKLDVERKRSKVKLATAMAVEYRRESAKLHARLTSEGIPLEPLSEEPVLDEEEYPVEEGTMPTLPVSETQEVAHE
jgi:hypothetical protein